MVTLNKIYTRTGDKGTTALATGERVPKTHARLAAYGTVDEVNATLGVVRQHTKKLNKIDAMLGRIQNDLFDLGADLSTPDDGAERSWEPLRVVATQVERLESEIDFMNNVLEPLNSFILPGGHPAAAYLHMARTQIRRAEREALAIADGAPVSEASLQYLNRLSDFFFVAARFVNHQTEVEDPLWVPGQNK
ncbi:MAG: cob(I)yrinic acid a,c-diamide adenosyltransferase [Alphaproteobacteria bacterium]